MSDSPTDVTPEEREDAQDISRADAVRDAQRLLRRGTDAVLCTHSKRIAGYPFGSVAPYALDARGAPILFISTIAEHTKNLEADPRCSIFVQEDAGDGDAQAHGRITLLGRATPVDARELDDARARYLARLPSAEGYSDTHDFVFYRLAIEHVRFIGGFGRIFWLYAADVALDPARDPLAQGARGIIDHMNEDHSDALLSYCRAFKNISPKSAKMIGVDQWGFDVECDPQGRVRFDFEEPATMQSIRATVVAMAKKARELLAK